MVAYNQIFLLGFLNFTASMGLALLLAAVWLRWRDTRPGMVLATSAIGAVALFFCHLMGLLFFALLIGGHELAWLWRLPRKRMLFGRALLARFGSTPTISRRWLRRSSRTLRRGQL